MVGHAILSCGCCAILASLASARQIVDTSFEPPIFSLGDVVGQGGWVTDGGGTAGAVVNVRSHTGANSLQINSSAITLPSWWYVPINLDASGQIVNVFWSMYIDPPSTTARSSYGIDIYSPNVTRMLDVWSEGLFDGELLHNAIGTGTIVPPREWHDYRVRLNFINFNYEVFYDGVSTATGALESSVGAVIGDIDIWAADPNSDVAYFDDFRIILGDPIPVCPADVDNDGDIANGSHPDGAVTIEDLLFYLAAFEAGLPAADLDNDGDPANGGQPDGAVTIEDLIFFLARFEGGC